MQVHEERGPWSVLPHNLNWKLSSVLKKSSEQIRDEFPAQTQIQV